MSDVFHSTEFDHLDETTKLIVVGFIHEQSEKICQHIPHIVDIFTLRFLDDHFMMNRGSYQWTISSPQQVQRILSAPSNSSINSEVFKMSGLQWRMQLYPNGRSSTSISAGHFGVFVRLLSLPKEWKYILVQQTIICHATNTVRHHVVKYDKATMS